ncbi:MAG: hypoxanthine phosphoribosyltransferase [Elusimicrobia bacterium]|nr:hypoxanthine phosphoribosyltransferase [Elusimicrobiota bacterium]
MTSTRVNPRSSGAWIKGILISEKRIKERIKELAEEISRDYFKKEVLLVAILDGSIVFLSDLIRELKINFSIDFVSVSSYEGSKSTGKVNILKEMRNDPSEKNVLLVEDIIDTGFTLDQVRRSILSKNPSSLKICVLLDKSDARKIPVDIDYAGFKIPKQFVVGYGLDYNGKHRGLPFIGVFE